MESKAKIALAALAVAIVMIVSMMAVTLFEHDDRYPDGDEGCIGAEDKVAVVYFSNTGNTEKVAVTLANYIGADLYRIVPSVPYSSDDTAWTPESRAYKEAMDSSSRPAIEDMDADFSQYDVILLGHPIWNYKAPRCVQTFLESHDLSGTKIVPFCTSTSSPLSGAISELTESSPDSVWMSGHRFPETFRGESVIDWARYLLGQN